MVSKEIGTTEAAANGSGAALRVLVVGGGIAGQAACEELRALDGAAEITMVCEEPRLPFDRVGLSTLLAGMDAAHDRRDVAGDVHRGDLLDPDHRPHPRWRGDRPRPGKAA